MRKSSSRNLFNPKRLPPESRHRPRRRRPAASCRRRCDFASRNSARRPRWHLCPLRLRREPRRGSRRRARGQRHRLLGVPLRAPYRDSHNPQAPRGRLCRRDQVSERHRDRPVHVRRRCPLAGRVRCRLSPSALNNRAERRDRVDHTRIGRACRRGRRCGRKVRVPRRDNGASRSPGRPHSRRCRRRRQSRARSRLPRA